MFQIRTTGSDATPYRTITGYEISAAELKRQNPDERLLAWDGDRVAARCGLWWTRVAALPGQRIGVIGHYYALSAPAGEAVLNAGCTRLAEGGGTLAIGPMDGNTWQRYRFVTERGTEPPFFLEPTNPEDWPGHWTAAGFAPLARYHSALTTDLATRDPRSAETTRTLTERGITIRPLDLADFGAELARVHALSLVSFANNFLYSPISSQEFAEQYAPLRAFIRPELALLAEHAGELIGFIIAVPDLLQAKRGVVVDTAIAKTMAVHPAHAGSGLGGYLMDRVHAAMHTLGFRRAIHALFHSENRSGKISLRSAVPIRTYTLFARRLGVAS